jgi:hypothetical protein
MAPPSTTTAVEESDWAIDLPSEVWALVAEHRGVVGACQLRRVNKASRAGCDEYLSGLPGLVVCGGRASAGGSVRDVLRLDLATMRWEPMPALVTGRRLHACCAVRGALVVLGGVIGGRRTSSVEILSSEEGGAFVELPPLSCGGIEGAAAIVVDESDSAAGQVLLLGGWDGSGLVSTVQLVDLATGACAPQSNLLHPRCTSASRRLLDGRIVCAGGFGGESSSAELWGPPEQGAADAPWIWRELPAMSADRSCCSGCVMSDGRFAVLGGFTTSCEALAFDGDAHWDPLPPMHETRAHFALTQPPRTPARWRSPPPPSRKMPTGPSTSPARCGPSSPKNEASSGRVR